jgi:hypothetical protein
MGVTSKLLNPERRRRAVTVLQEHYRASERLVCRVVGQHHSTQRYGGKVVDLEEAKLRSRLREIAAEHIRWGRRMAYRLLRREGWTVNHKRVQRLWRDEGLQRPISRKRKRARPADGSVRHHPGRTPPPGVGHGLPVRCHRRWPQAQVPERDRRAQPSVHGDPGGQALQGQRRGGRAGGADERLFGTDVNPVR